MEESTESSESQAHTDEQSQAEASSQTAEQPRAVPSTDIERLQALKAREGTKAANEQALRQLVSVLDPHPNDHALAYRDVLGRLQTVLTRELQAQEV